MHKMTIKDKKTFKLLLRNKVEKYIRQFPVYFFGNIIINLILLVSMVLMIIFLVDTTMLEYLILIAVTIGIFKITFQGFLRNINILKKIAAGKYKFGIEEFEIDNAVEFLEDFPLEKEKVERAKVALSFGKLIDVFEAAKIISLEGEFYDLGLLFKNEASETLSVDIESIPKKTSLKEK